MTVTGETLLKHGEIVDLNIDCTGSAPWLYCIYRKEKGYNITGNSFLTNFKVVCSPSDGGETDHCIETLTLPFGATLDSKLLENVEPTPTGSFLR